jgi:hypothetical protein
VDRSLLQRIAVIAVAIPIFAWLVVGLVGARLQAEAQPIVDRAARGPISEAQLAEGRDLLRRARRLSADRRPLLDGAALLAAAGRRDEAVAELDRLLDDEPENFEAWVLLFVLDADRRDEALRRLRDLNPWAADPLERIGRRSP